MTSGQWDLNALEAMEREALEVFDALEVPEMVLRSSPSVHIPSSTAHYSHSHSHHHHHQQHIPQNVILAGGGTEDVMDIELEDHIKHCSCTCNHMGYGNFMDYQVIVFLFVSFTFLYTLLLLNYVKKNVLVKLKCAVHTKHVCPKR